MKQQIQIYYRDLSKLSALPVENFEKIMDEKEKKRFYGMKNKQQKFIYAATRLCAKDILGNLLRLDPKTILFDYKKHGKPFMPEAANIEFNISHSQSMLMLAVCKNPVGVDIEFLSPRKNMDKTARRYFSKVEQTRYFQAEPSAQIEVFYSIWTAKEAILKASGKGITVDMSAMSAGTGNTWQDVECEGQYFVENIPCPAGFCAAIASTDKQPLIVPEYIDC